MMMVMEVVRIDEQGRLVIPKSIRERKGMVGEVLLEEVENGVLLRPKRKGGWNLILDRKPDVEWSSVLSISLESASADDLIFG